MQINLTGHHIDITDSLKQYVENKFQRLEKHFAYITNVHIILTVEKARQKAEATVHINHGNLFANDEQDDMYTAINNLIDKLDRQLKKHKEKHTERQQAK